MGPPRRDHMPGPGWLRQLRPDRAGPEQHRDRIAHPRSRAARLRRRAPVLVPGPGRATGIRGLPPSAAEVPRWFVTWAFLFSSSDRLAASADDATRQICSMRHDRTFEFGE